ncbi:hypothetical protein D4R87_02900 [bacterium]|nr:MAG: hypothetical protein D4R87_02900 [bacterium]
MRENYTQPIIIKQDQKILAKVFFFIEHNILDTNKDDIIDQLIINMQLSTSGYAGFSEKKHLKKFLINQIFDEKDNFGETEKREIDQQIVLKIVKQAIKKCKKIIPSTITEIYVFPSYGSFVKNKMDGSTGYSSWKNCMLVFIDPTCKKWKESLSSTIIHEYLHTVTHQHHKWETLLDSLIFEGLAENFTEYIEKNISTWANSLNLKQSQEYFKKLTNNLYSEDEIVYHSVFFGNKKYPQWAGYAIGYNIVKSFLNNYTDIKWEQLVKLKSNDILSKSNFK